MKLILIGVLLISMIYCMVNKEKSGAYYEDESGNPGA